MEKVKVKIGVVVDRNGKWIGYGWKEMRGLEAFDTIREELEPGEARYWVEAELAIPCVKTVEGKAEEIKSPKSGE